MGVVGVALAVGAWQRLPSAGAGDPHPSIWDGLSTAIPFAAGLFCIALGLYILATFFFDWPLPPTLQERKATRRSADGNAPEGVPSAAAADLSAMLPNRSIQLPPGRKLLRETPEGLEVQPLPEGSSPIVKEAQPPDNHETS